MEVIHNLTIDLLRPARSVIRLTQEDNARKIRLTLLADNSPYNVAQGITEDVLAFVEYLRPDGTGGMYDTTSGGDTAVELEDSNVNNVWLVTLDGNCFTVPGWTQINVRFETESGKRIHTFPIMVDVAQTASSDTESTDWGELNSIADLRNAVAAMWDSMFSPEAKQLLLDFLKDISYFVDDHASEKFDALEAALFRTANVISISAVFDQGSATIYDTDDLDTLKQYLTVTATYEDMSTREVTGYTLSGTLTEGTSTITVEYSGKATTFDVTVTTAVLYSIENYSFENESINTEIALLETEHDWTIAGDFDLTTSPTSGNGSSYRFTHTNAVDASVTAISFGKSTSASTAMQLTYMGSAVYVGANNVGTGRHRFVITHTSGSGKVDIKYRKNTDSAVTAASVEFVDINPWKLRCVVTVDAAPYALRLTETVVDLAPEQMTYEEQSVERAVNDSVQDWVSNFMLGTKEFPAGIWSPGYQQFLITWPQTATQARYTPFVNVSDADGHAYTANIQTPFEYGEVNVSFDSLVQAGVAPGRVYRILVSGIGDCRLFTQFLAGHVQVWNERKTVMPVFNLTANYEVALTVNGRNYTIPVGTTQIPEITLTQGWNDIYMPLDTEVGITEFTMTFREGKL